MAQRIEKAFLDPVHGFILIDDDWLLRLIDGAEFQRLRRVRQLGASFGTYHGAEHTRFGHSLGALHIMRRILDRFAYVHGPPDEETATVAQAAALLHDVGHGPLSHCTEYVLTPYGHEHWTRQMLLGDTDIGRELRRMDRSLPEKVAAVVAGTATPPWVAELVSSELDVDRMDYLLRDALFTGAEYGRFQLDRIVNTLVLRDDRVVVQHKGMQAIEEYVLARHFMYWRVYLHKTIRGMELLLRAALRRVRRRLAERPAEAKAAGALAPFFRDAESVDVKQYAAVDDADLFVALKTWARGDDGVLADLSRRFLERRLLKPVFPAPTAALSAEAVAAARAEVAAAGFDPDYYCLVDRAGDVPYDPYREARPDGREARPDGREARPDGREARLNGRGAGPDGREARPDGREARLDGRGGRSRDREADPRRDAGAERSIVVLDPAGEEVEISALSGLIRGLARSPEKGGNVYVPASCRPAVRAALASTKMNL